MLLKDDEEAGMCVYFLKVDSAFSEILTFRSIKENNQQEVYQTFVKQRYLRKRFKHSRTRARTNWNRAARMTAP